MRQPFPAEQIEGEVTLQGSGANRRYVQISDQLRAWNAQGPVVSRKKLSSRLTFEYVVRNLIDDLGGLKDDRAFNESWMIFCQENLAAEKRIATQDRQAAYESGREDAIKAIMAGRVQLPPAPLPGPDRFDPTRPDMNVILVGQGNGRDTAVSSDEVERAREAALHLGAARASAVVSNAAPWPIVGIQAADANPLAGEPASTTTLRVLFERFLIEEKKRYGDDRARSEIGPIVGFLFDLIGDKAPDRYTMGDWALLNDAIPAIPSRTGIPRDHAATLYKRYLYGKTNPDKAVRPATAATITGNYHWALRRFLKWLVTWQYLTKVPPLNMVSAANLVSLPRDGFEDDEVVEIISQPLFTGCRSRRLKWTKGNLLIQGYDYWNFLILLLTGMRPGEVAPLMVEDIKQKEGYAYIDLRAFNTRKGRVSRAEARQIKTRSSDRIVPLHPLLIDLGLLAHRDHMRQAGSARLFPDVVPYIKRDGRIRWSQSSSKSWQYLKSRGIITREDVTLYSTRHTMAEMIDQLQLADRTRNRVLGHVGNAGAAGRYGRNGLLSEADLHTITAISNPLIDRMRAILMDALARVEQGELLLIRPEAPRPRKAPTGA